MIKRGDKGTVGGKPARVVADDLKGNYVLIIAVMNREGYESVIERWADGCCCDGAPFIPSKPWDSLKPTDPCYVKCNKRDEWGPRVFAGVNESGEPEVFIGQGRRWVFQYLVPAKLIDGELVPVEES